MQLLQNNIRLKNYLTLVLFSLTLIIFAQNPQRIYKGFNLNQQQLEVFTSDGTYLLKPYSTKIIETSFIPNGEQFNSNSHAVVLIPEKSEFMLKDNPVKLEFISSGISVKIEKSPFKIAYYFKDNELISEKIGYQKNENSFQMEFNLDSEEILYGGGARVLGMNRRGNKLQLYNRAHYGYETRSELMNYTMPLVLSSKIYAVHFDNAPIGFLDLDSQKDNTLGYESISGRKTYQVIAGNDWYDLIDQYTNLTGKQPILPRWALGNFSSRFGYHSEKETRETVQKFKDDNIPLDAVIIDIYWFGKDIKGHMGNFEFLKDSFPTPEKMMSDFKLKGVKTILVSEPFILTTSKKWEEAAGNNYLGKDKNGNPYRYDFYFGNTGIIDIYNPKAKEWFWNIYKEFTQKGVSGWWGDLGEPEVHPSDLQHETGSADEVHNIYGHDWARLIQEGYQKDFSDQRPFILMRSGYSGSQRLGMIPWSGDVSRSWGGLQPQPEIALQMGMQGLAFMHSDLGGFAGGEQFVAELYTRWLQYGVFQPIYRPHAQEHIAPEPVFHDEKTKILAKKSIELRYRLLPYNYTLAFENNQTGKPLMRPLFFEEPENKLLLETSDSYLWGDSFLVTPIKKPGMKEIEVYFPKNHRWFDFYTGQKYEAGTTQKVDVKEGYIPTFVRGGSFIPMIKTIQTTDDYSLNQFDLHFYVDESVKKSKGHLYNDDGKTPKAFEKGQYELISFESSVDKKKLELSIHQKQGADFNSEAKLITVKLHQLNAKPKRVYIDKKRMSFEWNEQTKELTVKVSLSTNQSKPIKIKLIN
ncbi:MAG: glycoside hydrolase family 31 protein [Flavobacteriaceae bacterium]|nr:glycoside hydrolase family 31 protein [Flavobacteriaceae bacterium]